MDWQALITALLVAACSGYAAWNVMPAAWRRRLAGRLGQPIPAASGCGSGCDGCSSNKPAAGATSGAAVIRIVRRPPQR